MTATPTSTDGNCPSCKSNNWKTLEALTLTQRTRTESTTTGNRSHHRRETIGHGATEAATRYAPPARPVDYDQLARYRKGCSDAIAAAEGRLAEIDAASKQPNQVLPNLLRAGPEAKGTTFDSYARKLDALLQYDAEYTQWKATRICLRCAVTFIDAKTNLPKAPAMAFCFAGQERHCPSCKSYFWKDPEAVAEHRERLANSALARAQEQLRDAEDAERSAAANPRPSGLLSRLAAFLTPSPMGVDEARAELAEAERAHRRAINSVLALRRGFEGKKGVRWCVGCKSIYRGDFPTNAEC
jgi:hypothetical protein